MKMRNMLAVAVAVAMALASGLGSAVGPSSVKGILEGASPGTVRAVQNHLLGLGYEFVRRTGIVDEETRIAVDLWVASVGQIDAVRAVEALSAGGTARLVAPEFAGVPSGLVAQEGLGPSPAVVRGDEPAVSANEVRAVCGRLGRPGSPDLMAGALRGPASNRVVIENRDQVAYYVKLVKEGERPSIAFWVPPGARLVRGGVPGGTYVVAFAAAADLEALCRGHAPYVQVARFVDETLFPAGARSGKLSVVFGSRELQSPISPLDRELFRSY